MKCYPPLRWLTALALLALACPARATSIIVPDFDSMVGSSDYIVRAVVKSVASEWRDNPSRTGQRYIGTLVELDVREVIKGTPPTPLVLDLVGGRVGNRGMTIEGAPQFTVGQESILFIQGNGRNIIPLVGFSHGYWPVRRDQRTGQDQVMRSNGRLLYSEQEVTLPESALGAAPARDPKARPLTAADFAALVRKSPKFLHREAVK